MVASVHKRRLRVLDTFSSVTSGTVSKRHDGLYFLQHGRDQDQMQEHIGLLLKPKYQFWQPGKLVLRSRCYQDLS